MSITDQLLAAFLLYGLPLLFGATMAASAGVPIPVRLMLVQAGSFAEQGEMELWPVIVVAIIAAVLGDQVGFGLARWGGRRLLVRLGRGINLEARINRAEGLARRWGGAGIFLSRWLVTELGSLINVTSGISAYPWRWFLLWDVLGEVTWVVLYVMLGYFFSTRVQTMAEIFGNLAWAILGLLLAIFLAWKLLGYLRLAGAVREEAMGAG